MKPRSKLNNMGQMEKRETAAARRLWFTLFVLLWTMAPWCPQSVAQNKGKTVTVTLREASIDEFFDAIQRQTGLNFIMTTAEKRKAP